MQWASAIRMSDHAHKPLDIAREPRFNVLRFVETHPKPLRSNESPPYVILKHLRMRPSDSVVLAGWRPSSPLSHVTADGAIGAIRSRASDPGVRRTARRGKSSVQVFCRNWSQSTTSRVPARATSADFWTRCFGCRLVGRSHPHGPINGTRPYGVKVKARCRRRDATLRSFV